jgi:hypothetical protein
MRAGRRRPPRAAGDRGLAVAAFLTGEQAAA